MTLRASLFEGLNVGLKSSTLTKYDVPAQLLADFNFSAPVESYDFSSANATDEWLLQETSGTHANNVGSATLSNTGGLQGQDAVGLWDGSSYIARNAWEGLDNGDYLVCSDTTVGDPGGSDFCVRVVFRTNDTVNNAYIVSKWDSGPKGWWIRLNSSGNPRFEVDDGTNPPVTVASAASVTDGAWHHTTAWWDESTNTAYIKTDLLAEVSTTGSATAATTTTAIHVNQRSGLVGDGSHMQVAYLGVCVGANAEAMYDETTTLPGSDPTSLLTTISRASLISTEVAAGYVCHFGQGVTNDQLPIGYNANFSDTNKLGLYCNSAVTNLIVQSEDIAGAAWNTSNITKAADQADSPDGFRNADSITATNINAFIYDDFTTAGSTEYTFSCWIKRNGGSDVAGEINLQQIVPSVSVLGTQAFTATNTWQRVSVTATTVSGGTTTRPRVQIDTNTESILVWGCQLELGDGAGAYIRTNGASASLTSSDYEALGTAGQYCKAATGEIEIINVMPHTVSGNHRLVNINEANNNNMIDVTWLNGSQINNANRDSGGTSQASLTHSGLTSDTEYTVKIIWDESGGLSLGGGEDVASYINGADELTDVGSYTTTDTLTRVQIGNYRAPASQYAPDGFIQRIRIWDKEVV